MITQVHDQILIGEDTDCPPGLNIAGTKATLHCCKFPCWSCIVGAKQLPKEHPQYLMCIYPFDLFLNIIDPPVPLFKHETFVAAREFARRHLMRGNKLFIHCNRGESRAPSIAMLIMAKDLDVIGNESYDVAKEEFERIYPAFKPGKGIETFMRENWSIL